MKGAFTWTLVAVAARAATALRLGHETPERYDPFELEMRRRLLFAIGILDTHSALDRGTMPILPSTTFQSKPLCINDADMMRGVGETTSEFKDMSHTALIYDAMICQRRMCELSMDPQDGWNHWSEKLRIVAEFEESVQNRHCVFDKSTAPLEMLLQMTGKKIMASMQLLLRRPPYKQANNAVPPWDEFNVMESAMEVLESHMQPIPVELEPWAWKNWIQWHALAIILAELRVNPQAPDSDHAFGIATKAFDYYKEIIADSDSGMLWRPIEKLMRQVRNAREISRPGILDHSQAYKELVMRDWVDFSPPCPSMQDLDQSFVYSQTHPLTPLSVWGQFLQDIDLDYPMQRTS